MSDPSSATVPVPELIRRCYDRAKGLGHEGLGAVREELLRQLDELLGRAGLPAPLDLPEGARLVLAPELLAAAYRPDGDPSGRRALVTALRSGNLVLTHPLLKRTIEAFQALDLEVRTVTLWIAAMTVLPEWTVPAEELPEVLAALEGGERDLAAALVGAASVGAVFAVLGKRAWTREAGRIEGVHVVTPNPEPRATEVAMSTAPTYLVTGATGGLGTEVVRLLLDGGARVIAVGSRAESVHALRQVLHNPARLETRVGDLMSEPGVQALFESLGDLELDGVAHLVGGYLGGVSVAETSLDSFRRMYALNVDACFLVLRATCRRWIAAERRGAMVVMGSTSGRSGKQGHLAYASSKAAVANLVQSAAEDLAPKRIRVNAILPGTIATDANLEAMPKADHDQWVSPLQVGRAIQYLLSPASEGVTGALMEVAGWGYLAD